MLSLTQLAEQDWIPSPHAQRVQDEVRRKYAKCDTEELRLTLDANREYALTKSTEMLNLQIKMRVLEDMLKERRA